jgi:hypothetical protein
MAIVFLGGMTIGYFTQSAVGTLGAKDTHAPNRTAIEKLYQQDIEATLSHWHARGSNVKVNVICLANLHR